MNGERTVMSIMNQTTADWTITSIPSLADRAAPWKGPDHCERASGGEVQVFGALVSEFPESYEGEPGSASLLARELEISGEEISNLSVAGHTRREVIPWLGCALVAHFALLLAAHLFPATLPAPAAELPFIVVSLAGCGGAGEGGPGEANAAEGSAGGLNVTEETSLAEPRLSAKPEDRGRNAETLAEMPQASVPEVVPRAALESVSATSPAIPEKTVARSEPKPARKPPVSVIRPKPAKIVRNATEEKVVSNRIHSEVPTDGGGPVRPGGGETGTDTGGGPGPGGSGNSGSVFGEGGSGVGVGGMPAEFTLQQVEHPPVILRKVEPEFPDAARRMGISGKVVVRFLVKTDGRVTRVSILDARPSGLFEKSVLETLDKWYFKPGARKGKAVATWVVQPIQFRLAK